MRERKQSDSTYAITFFMVDSADHVTGKTGLTPTVTVSKNGAAFGAASGTVSEISSGWYKLSGAGLATDTNTLGSLIVHATATGADPFDGHWTVVPWDPFDSVRMGLTALPNAAAEASGGLFTRGTGAGQIRQDANGRIDVNAKAWRDTALPAENVAGYPLVDAAKWVGGTIPAVNVTGVPLVDAKYILGTALTESAGAGKLAGAFTTFFNVASPSLTTAGVNQTGDSYARLGAPAGASIAADIATRVGGSDAIPASPTSGTYAEALWYVSQMVGRRGTAQGGTSTTLTLDSGASAQDNLYTGYGIKIISGTGSGQSGTITGYNGTTKVATIARKGGTGGWDTTPDNTSVFLIERQPLANVGLWQGTPPLALSSQRVQVVVAAYATGQDPATLVLDVAASGHNTSGTVGAKINTAGSAADPLSNAVPGSYASGTAGYALGHIGSASITVTSPVATNGDTTIYQGDSYSATDGRALDYANTAGTWPDLTGASIAWDVSDGKLVVAGSVVTPTGTGQKVRAEPTAAQTATLPAGKYDLDVRATLASGRVVTLVRGKLTVADTEAY